MLKCRTEWPSGEHGRCARTRHEHGKSKERNSRLLLDRWHDEPGHPDLDDPRRRRSAGARRRRSGNGCNSEGERVRGCCRWWRGSHVADDAVQSTGRAEDSDELQVRVQCVNGRRGSQRLRVESPHQEAQHAGALCRAVGLHVHVWIESRHHHPHGGVPDDTR